MKAFLLAVPGPNSKDSRIGAAVIAAGAHKPELLEPVRVVYHETLKTLASESKSELPLILTLAANGIFMMELLGILSLERKEREKVFAKLLQMADECAE
jgi:hypothetical protein